VRVSNNWIYLQFLVYIFMLFTVKNLHIYQSNTSVHGMNTRQQNKPHVFQ